MDLIPIQQQVINGEEVNSVDARALHQSLGNKKQFANWITYQITSLGLVKNEDYVLLNQKVKQTSEDDNRGGHNAKDYLFTLDIAKHIALASRTKEGKEIRAYFIEVEKKSHTQELMPQEAIMSLLTQMSEGINMMAKTQGHMLDRIEALENKQIEMQFLKPETYRRSNEERFVADTISVLKQEEGLTQTELLARLGKARDDKTARRWLHGYDGTFWKACINQSVLNAYSYSLITED